MYNSKFWIFMLLDLITTFVLLVINIILYPEIESNDLVLLTLVSYLFGSTIVKRNREESKKNVA